MTQLAGASNKESNLDYEKERNVMRDRLGNLEKAINEKNEEMNRLRDYYTHIIEKL